MIREQDRTGRPEGVELANGGEAVEVRRAALQLRAKLNPHRRASASGQADAEPRVEVAVAAPVARPRSLGRHPGPARRAQACRERRVVQEPLEDRHQAVDVVGREAEATFVGRRDLDERRQVADHQRDPGRHRLEGLERRDEASRAVVAAGDDEDVELRVERRDLVVRHLAREDDRVRDPAPAASASSSARRSPSPTIRHATARPRERRRAVASTSSSWPSRAWSRLPRYPKTARPVSPSRAARSGSRGRGAKSSTSTPFATTTARSSRHAALDHLAAHRLRQRHDGVDREHRPRLGRPAPARVLGVLARLRVRRPGALEEGAHLVDDRDAEVRSERQADERPVGAARTGRGVDHGRPLLAGDARRQPAVVAQREVVGPLGRVGAAGIQAVVADPVHLLHGRASR